MTLKKNHILMALLILIIFLGFALGFLAGVNSGEAFLKDSCLKEVQKLNYELNNRANRLCDFNIKLINETGVLN